MLVPVFSSIYSVSSKSGSNVNRNQKLKSKLEVEIRNRDSKLETEKVTWETFRKTPFPQSRFFQVNYIRKGVNFRSWTN